LADIYSQSASDTTNASAILGKMIDGQTLPILSWGTTWTTVVYDEKIGYVLTSLLTPTTPSGVEIAPRGEVTAAASIYKSASQTSEVLKDAAVGTLLRTVQWNMGTGNVKWVQVVFDTNKVGYILQSALKAIPGAIPGEASGPAATPTPSAGASDKVKVIAGTNGEKIYAYGFYTMLEADKEMELAVGTELTLVVRDFKPGVSWVTYQGVTLFVYTKHLSS